MYQEYFLNTREPVITYATDVPTSNKLCNLCWSKGLIVKENIIDSNKYDGIKRLLEVVAKEEITTVYIDGIYELCKTHSQGAKALEGILRHNIKIVMPDWELDPLSSSFSVAVMVLKDLAKAESKRRSDAIKVGQRYSAEKYGRKCGRPRRRLPLKEIAEMRAKGLTWARISRELDIPKMTLHDRKEDIELYIKDYRLGEGN